MKKKDSIQQDAVNIGDVKQIIPEWKTNLKDNRITLKETKVIENCEPIICVTRCIEEVWKTISYRHSTEVLSTFKRTWTHLNQ